MKDVKWTKNAIFGILARPKIDHFGTTYMACQNAVFSKPDFLSVCNYMKKRQKMVFFTQKTKIIQREKRYSKAIKLCMSLLLK
jgi:hypothetical protein